MLQQRRYEQRVHNGLAWLDSQKGAHPELDVRAALSSGRLDLTLLDISDGHFCVLGQLCEGGYNRAVLFDYPDLVFPGRSVELGFCLPARYSVGNSGLTREWKRQLLALVGGTANEV